ncbi:MAG: EpsG family protein [Rikenellaceae bacterium]
MIIPLFTLFFFVSILYLEEQEYKEPNIWALLLISATMLFISTNRSVEMADAANYIYNFESGSESRFEPAYQLLRDVVASLTANYKWLFAAICSIALFVKFWAIDRIAPYIYGSILVYLSYFFILHDMIQIRAGVATGFLLFAIKYITERRLVPFLIFSAVAISFHYSTMIILPLWFVVRVRLSRMVWLSLLPLSYIVVMLGATSFEDIINHIPINQVQYLFDMYQSQMSLGIGVHIDLFNLLTLARVAICTVLIANVERVEECVDHFGVWLMIYTISLMIFILLSNLPVLAFRLSELLQVTEIVVIPALVYCFSDRVFGKVVVVATSLCYLLIITFINGYLL